MKIEPTLTDAAILTELGRRLTHRRIALGRTQAETATEAGVSKRTLERLEAGEAVQTPTLVRVLRELEALAVLDALLPPAKPGPAQSSSCAHTARCWLSYRARNPTASTWSRP